MHAVTNAHGCANSRGKMAQHFLIIPNFLVSLSLFDRRRDGEEGQVHDDPRGRRRSGDDGLGARCPQSHWRANRLRGPPLI